MNIKKMCLSAVFTAIVCIITKFIQIPIPLGYFNIGNTIILSFCYLMPCPYGIIIGSIGSALADLLSFPEWTIPTLFIKAFMPILYYAITKIKRSSITLTLFAGFISMLIPFGGYIFTGAILYGSIAAGFTQIPGLLLEYIANCILFTLLLFVINKSNIKKIINQDV